MAYRRKSYTYWDGDAIFPIPFEYLEQDDILVFINDEPTTDFVIENTQVKLNNIPTEVPAIIKIVSATDIDKAIVDWENVSSLDEDNLTLSDNQIRYAVQELYDNTEQFKTDTQEDFQEFREEIHTLLDDVSEAAELISSTIEAVDTAVLTTQEQALIATEQKAIATEQANIAKEQTELVASTANKALEDIDTLRTNTINELDTIVEDSVETVSGLANEITHNAQNIINRLGINLFDTKISDHILEGYEALGWALQGTYVYKEAIAGSRYGYPNFYAKCLEGYNNATGTETVNGVTVKVNANGHKFYDIANKSAIDSFFNTMGSADFYGVDTENERIFLPRNDYFVQLTTDTNKVNDTIEAGLPNITGTVKSGGSGADWMSGAFTYLNSATNGVSGNHDGGSDKNYASGTAQFSASSSNSIYGNSNTVQPPSSLKLLYYCVGNTVSDTSWVDVVTQVEGGVKDLEDKTNEGIEALANASNALRTTQITNCITEIPQRIKLELADGVLTLKAGSQVIVPNGFEDDGITPKFDYVTIESDQSLTKGTGTEQVMFFARNTTGTLMRYTISQIYSGSSAPTVTTQYARWYDTSTNKIKDTSNTGVTWAESYTSFPLGIGSTTDSSVSALAQVFNGMGYIGSTVWVDKGVKGLIPNGRNADGTLNNIEYTKNKISIATFTGGYADTFWLRLSPTGTLPNHGILTRYNIRSFSNAPTPAVDKWYSVYVEDENMFYYSSNGGAYFKDSAVDLGVYSSNANNQITSLKPKLPFRAIDYSDKSTVSGWGMPSSKYIDLTLGATGTQYTAPANGWVIVELNSKKLAELSINAYCGSSYISYTTFNPWDTNYPLRVSAPVTKGSNFQVWYTNLVTKNRFQFIYAQGEV